MATGEGAAALRRQPVQQGLGLLAMASACFIWGLGPLWIRTLLGYLPAIEVCLLRVTGGLILLSPGLLTLRPGQFRRMLARPATWLSGLFLSAGMLAYASALNYVRPAEVNLVYQSNLFVTALLGWWLFREPVPARRRWAIAVAAVGVATVILAKDSGGATGPWPSRLTGMALALLAGSASSLIQACIRDVADEGYGLPAQVLMHLVCGLVFLLRTGGRLHFSQPPDERFLTAMILLAVFGQAVGTCLVWYAVQRISLAQAGVTGAMQPVVTVAVTAAAGEVLPPVGLIGGALVVGGVIASALVEREVVAAAPEHRLERLPPPG